MRHSRVANWDNESADPYQGGHGTTTQFPGQNSCPDCETALPVGQTNCPNCDSEQQQSIQDQAQPTAPSDEALMPPVESKLEFLSFEVVSENHYCIPCGKKHVPSVYDSPHESGLNFYCKNCGDYTPHQNNRRRVCDSCGHPKPGKYCKNCGDFTSGHLA